MAKNARQTRKSKGNNKVILWSVLRPCSFKDDVLRAKDAFAVKAKRIKNKNIIVLYPEI